MRCDEAGLLLSDFREHSLPETEQHQVAEHLQQCAQCRADLAALDSLTSQARQWRDLSVPEWHRTAFAVPEKQRGQWLQWTSLATSALTLLLVVAKVDISSDDHGLRISFGGAPKPAASQMLTAEALEQRLNQFKEQQQLTITNQLAAWDITRQQDSQKMMTAVVNYARDQQQQDLAQWVNYWKTVRDQDQALQVKAFSDLLTTQQQSRLELRALKASLQNPTNSEAL
ncbi:zf-HC2 domain-containing protein [Permianibacter sp. IMCC34836]|uniref:zf-HC2 domain-containing protein n=1 Tax=Permianibacter fluminis TaxID=2738515 RepID=UPI00155173B8|nr:zf-HC2 domain-containing protein [Permianibacter fluminis]NQD37001.1 zf-HC2 domain-containing protein [Permianibacter fluminis]